MAGETTITIIGNLTADPELRWTQSGTPVADLTIASTPRAYDRQAGQWRDGETLFMRCSAWRDQAENIAETLRKGMRVIAQGRLGQRQYETRQGERRTVVEMQIDEIGPSLRNARAQVNRVTPPPPRDNHSEYPQQGVGQWPDTPQPNRHGEYQEKPPF